MNRPGSCEEPNNRMITLSNLCGYASISPLGNLTMVRPKLLSTKGVQQMLHCTLFGACISHILNFPKRQKGKSKVILGRVTDYQVCCYVFISVQFKETLLLESQ